MKIKSYIALLLTFVFLAKLIAIDADGLSLLYSDSNITFVNPYCKKENALNNTSQDLEFSEANVRPSEMFTLNGFCTSQFQLELYSWEMTDLNPFTIYTEYFTSKLSCLYMDNDSPPPRLV